MKHIFEYLFSKKSDLDKIKPFSKKNMRQWDVFITRNGKTWILIDQKLSLAMNVANHDEYTSFYLYQDDLTWLSGSAANSYDIISVWRGPADKISHNVNKNIFKFPGLRKIYSRDD